MKPEPRELQVVTAFGKFIEDTIVLATQPDEDELEFGPERTLVVQIKNNIGRIQQVIPSPIVDSWLSTSGRAYCSSNYGNILTYYNGEWSPEKVCERDECFGAIWGFSGQTDCEDIVLACSNESLFVRSEGSWSEHPMPQSVQMVNRLHGLSPDEVYICTDAGLLYWNGRELAEMEGPSDDLRGVLVLSRHEMLITGDRLHLWTDQGGWMGMDSPGGDGHTLAMVGFQDNVFIGTLKGILQYRSGSVEMVLNKFCNRLASVGNGVIAAGDEAFLFDGGKWIRLQLPMLGFRQELK